VTYATERETTEGKVFTVTGGDWDTVVGGTDPLHDERIVVNMGPQHPSTHGVLRLVLELEGETVTECRLVVGYLHTGIEKNLEFRNWVQGSTFVTRMDYLAPLFNETAYSLSVEKLLGIEEQITERATTIRVLMMELNRIASHLVWLGTIGLELGAISMMLYGFREREYILEIFEMITGLRMNMAYVRPGGVSQDVPPEAIVKIKEFLAMMPKKLKEYEDLLSGQPIWMERTKGVALLDVPACLTLGVTGPVLRSAGLGWDLRKQMPYCGYETYEFDVPTEPTGDVWGRYQVRMGEMRESLKLIESASTGCAPGRSWSPTRRSRGRPSWPSARTGSATPSSTSRRSWVSRWSR
jgi:NADH-quinone oxidoreductase subunit D